MRLPTKEELIVANDLIKIVEDDTTIVYTLEYLITIFEHSNTKEDFIYNLGFRTEDD